MSRTRTLMNFTSKFNADRFRQVMWDKPQRNHPNNVLILWRIILLKYLKFIVSQIEKQIQHDYRCMSTLSIF